MTELKPTGAVIDGRSARKAVTEARNAKWQRKCEEIWKKNPKLTVRSVAKNISRLVDIADGKTAETIRRNIKLPES